MPSSVKEASGTAESGREHAYQGPVYDFVLILVTLVAFGLLAVLVGFLDRRLSK